MLALTGTSVQEIANGRDADVWTLCRDSLRSDDARAARGLSLADGGARADACAEQDLRAQPQAGQGDWAARGAFSDRLLAQRARARDRGLHHYQQVSLGLPDQRA